MRHGLTAEPTPPEACSRPLATARARGAEGARRGGRVTASGGGGRASAVTLPPPTILAGTPTTVAPGGIGWSTTEIGDRYK